MELQGIVNDIARGIEQADARRPTALGVRTKKAYQPGIGPHTEAKAIQLVVEELQAWPSSPYSGAVQLQVPYPLSPRSRCDVVLGPATRPLWAVEVKMLRIMGDNAKPNDNMLMHILSPYPAHRSALTDVEKLLSSGFSSRKALLIYGFDYPEWSLAPAIEAFETLASSKVRLSSRVQASFTGLVHPVHKEGEVLAWEIFGLSQ